MSGFDDTRRVIENLFLPSVGGATVYLENVRRPSAAGNPPSPSAWIALTVGEDTHTGPRTDRISLGSNPARRRVGSIMVNVFTALGAGSQPGDAIVDAVYALTNEVVLTAGDWKVSLGSPQKLSSGESPDGSWWQHNVLIPYERK